MTAKRFFSTSPDRSVVFIRAMVGAVFISEGMQKFLFAAQLGAGRLAKLGFPHPELLGLDDFPRFVIGAGLQTVANQP